MYKNPILNCDFSDPDVIRVKDTFYMVSSSFNFIPGLPVLTSKDLINWTIVNYAAREIPLRKYDVPQHGKGLWAPSIRYYKGEFYIFAATPDDGIFFTKAKDPLGKWSELKCIFKGSGYEDPCPLWQDGKLYVVHGFVKSRIGFNSKLGLMEFDENTFEQTGADKIIFDGTVTQPTIEGPKFYIRNGWYYIFAPAGGVENGWQTVLRSRSIDGPYEEKIVLRQGKSNINGPHQGAWITTCAGEDWFIHFQQKGVLGRIVCLQPVRWENDWPVMGKDGEAVEEWKMPDCGENAVQTEEIEGFEWQTFCNRSECKLTDDSLLWNDPQVFTKPVYKNEFKFSKNFKVSKDKTNGRSGIIFAGNQYGALILQNNRLKFVISEGDGDEFRKESVRKEVELTGVSNVQLSLEYKLTNVSNAEVVFYAADENKNILLKTDPVIMERAHWVGGRYGYFDYSFSEIL